MRLGMTKVLSLIALAIILVAHGALHVEAQPAPRIFRIGWLAQGRPDTIPGALDALIGRLGTLGYVEGRNLVFERRWADGESGRLPGLAADLIRANVDLLLTNGPTAAMAAVRATTAIPIIMVAIGSPVELGLVANLARPGGNVTGLTLDTGPAIHGKRLGLLKEAIPKLSRVALLVDTTIERRGSWETIQAAAQMLGLKPQRVEVGAAEDFDRAFATITRARPDALVVLPSPFLASYRSRIVDFATKSRIPLASGARPYVDVGGLMSYGPNLIDIHVRAARYVDQILKGANPGDLPVEQPTRFELVINMKTARTLGLTVPPSLLQRADEVIR